MPTNILRVGVKRMRPDSFQWCPVTGQGAKGTNWCMGSSVSTQRRTSSLWGWRSTGTGCPEGLWILLFWRYSTLIWSQSCAACSRWPCFVREVGQHDHQRSLRPLLFCDSVIYSKRSGCSDPHPTWPWRFLGMGHIPPLWAMCSTVSLSLS